LLRGAGRRFCDVTDQTDDARPLPEQVEELRDEVEALRLQWRLVTEAVLRIGRSNIDPEVREIIAGLRTMLAADETLG
jgi:radical SAM superfamily enzyme YgiQ (UPF0313 family)